MGGMPANLSPEYKAAEAAYRRAREPQERLDLLREMLRAIPKHKGTDHLQADIKTRIKELTTELQAQRRTGARGAPPTFIRPEGAAQVVLLGPPNTGKSALHDRLTGSHAQEGPYPFTTQHPQPGMVPVRDIALQLVDLPSVSPRHPVPWIGNAVQAADGCLLVLDLAEPGCVEATVEAVDMLQDRKVVLVEDWPADEGPRHGEGDPFTTFLPTALLVNKSDRLDDPQAELQVLRDLTGYGFPALCVSSVTGSGLDAVGSWLFERLGVVRVYTKVPGKPADMDRPFTLRMGQTVGDVAEQVHRDIAGSLKYARIWGRDSFDGQQVGREHRVVDGDVLELHA
ncbi:MAG TPA: GTPase [Gemmatimonadales bacterium]|nr:GTPase [Gemmatimonadales bacterium]